MKKNLLNHALVLLFFTSFTALKSFAQNDKIKVSQDPKFEQLLSEKRKINNTISLNEGYKIQIYNGDIESCRRELNKFKSSFNRLDVTIIFNTPEYKVWAGNFKSKIDAERHLLEIRKRHSSAIIIKPNR